MEEQRQSEVQQQPLTAEQRKKLNEEIIAKIRQGAFDTVREAYPDDDGTQKWPMDGSGNVWVGNPEANPYGPNGEDIQIKAD